MRICVVQQTLDVHVPKPFVKWAGGKRQLLPLLTKMFPKGCGTYHEPFLGGGAVLFNILASGKNVSCRASDLNSDLILAYLAVRDRVEDLIEALREHDAAFKKDRKVYYYAVRAQTPGGHIEKASRLLFLNKTCFNGLYRVNRRGMFNVPMGSYANPNIVNEDGLRLASKALRSGQVDLECNDFEKALDRAKPGDMVYLDPPYHPVSKDGNFTGYTRGDFTLADLERLAAACNRLDELGCRVMMSNSCAREVTSLFGKEPWVVRSVTAARCINSDGRNRTGHREVVITNYAKRPAEAVPSGVRARTPEGPVPEPRVRLAGPPVQSL